MNPQKERKKYLMHPSRQIQTQQAPQQQQQQMNQQYQPQNLQQKKSNPFSKGPKKNIQNTFANNNQQQTEKTQQQKQKYPNIKIFPRPLIQQKNSITSQIHDTSQNFEQLPSLMYEYQTVDGGNATCRHARSSVYVIPDNQSNLRKSQIKFNVVFTPLAETGENDTAVPYVDKRQQEVLRCDRCGTFVNCFFKFEQQWKKYTCNICEYKGTTSEKNYSQEVEFKSENYPEFFNSVYDFILPDSYKLNQINSNNILICFDMSFQSIKNGSFNHIISCIRNLLDHFPEDVNMGFVLYDQFVSFLRIYEDDLEISILRGCDTKNPACPLSFKELFFNVKSQREVLEYLINFIEQLAEKQYQNNPLELQNSPHCLETLGKTLMDVFRSKGGRAIICTSVHKNKSNEIVKYEEKEKVPTFKPKVETFEQLGDILGQKTVTVDMFITTDQEIELKTISPLSLKNGGKIYFYPNFQLYDYSEKIYFDLFRCLTVQRGFDVACRLRSSSGIQILNYTTPRGQLHTLDFRLPSLSADQHIIAQMQLGENLKGKKKVYLQFVTLYTNSYDTRLMRIINMALNVTNDMQHFYKNMDCNSFSYSFIQHMAYKLFEKPQKDVNDFVMKEIIKLFRYYRNEVGGKYDSKEFALPERLKYFPLYLHTTLSRPAFNYKNQKPADYQFYTLLQLIQSKINLAVFQLYPKIFDIGELYLELKQDPSSCLPGTEPNDVTVLPDSLPSVAQILDNNLGQVLIIDNGNFIFVYVREIANQELLEAMFGVSTFEEILDQEDFPEFVQLEDSELNARAHAIIARLKSTKEGEQQPVVTLLENQQNTNRWLKDCFIESLGNYFGFDYWDFLSQLHERVKDD